MVAVVARSQLLAFIRRRIEGLVDSILFSAGASTGGTLSSHIQGHACFLTRPQRHQAEYASRDPPLRIVQLLGEGRPMKEIAGLLDLSEKTVEFHKHHVMKAFNLENNAALVLFALKQGLISLNC
jgi:DNA-binding NarL/FixJ family response regulator